MAKLTFTGLDGYIAQLEKLRQSADGITKKALYEGAGVTADEIRSAVEALPTDNDRSAGHYGRTEGGACKGAGCCVLPIGGGQD